MPRIFDNIAQELLPALKNTFSGSTRADFCIGYFNLRGWKLLDEHVEAWSGGEGPCRLLVGMQKLPHEELREALSLIASTGAMDNQAALRIKKRLAEEFRQQLAMGVPSNADETALRRLAGQIRAKKVIVKLFLRHPLHAKLYLLFRPDTDSPIVSYLGSSNLTFSGLSGQGELNVDVLDHDACHKLARWFEDRWNDSLCLDVSEELATLIDQSWAREELIPPYHIYIKMAYHLSREAIAGLNEFTIPKEVGQKLFGFQTAAVKIAAHHLNKRNGVLIGDVVGLGKTLMAAALARIFEDDQFLETLILCPKNLVSMWEDYRARYGLRGRVLSTSRVTQELPTLKRYRLVLIDESHNLRNREGKRYRAIQEYIQANESKCILLSATPYNKTYLDLSSQLRLFVNEDQELSIRPEALLRELGETEFIRRHQCPIRSLAAFEKSEYPDDWRDLMRLYLVRRTRSFIQDNYAEVDPATGRRFLTFDDGTKSYFPAREPRTVKFKLDEKSDTDQYAKLFSQPVVDTINGLNLPRYGLGNYVAATPHKAPTAAEAKMIQDLSRAGKRLMGFCRTNLFKRLESSGAAFVQSVERHILRNYVYLHAIDNGLAIPIGTQDAESLDPRFCDEDVSEGRGSLFEDDGDTAEVQGERFTLRDEASFTRLAAAIYAGYANEHSKRFRWLGPHLFIKELSDDLRSDAATLLRILDDVGEWNAQADAKLEALHRLVAAKHGKEKVLVFSQFADTVRYVVDELAARGVKGVAGATGDVEDPTALAWRFSPVSNDKRERVAPADELRVLVATDILSEGQNLQDAAIVVNFDLPWAIIRLIQRAGRVDRIGQRSEKILCYSFLPAEGVERIIRLRARVRVRLKQNAEVVGTDETFFEDDSNEQTILNLYNEKAGILDGDVDGEVDLASYAYQIWKNAVDAHPGLEKIVADLPDVVYSTRHHEAGPKAPAGVLVYLRTADDNDALAYVDTTGKSITESQFEILKMAECVPGTLAIARSDRHHALVQEGVKHIVREERRVGGQLGRPSGARFRTYERLKRYVNDMKGTLFESAELLRAIDEIYRFTLRQSAINTLNRQLKSGIGDSALASLVMALRQEDRLCNVENDPEANEPHIICSLGLFASEGGR